MNTFIFTLNIGNFDMDSEDQAEQLDWEFSDIYASQIDDEITLTFVSSSMVESRVDFVLDAISFLNGLNPRIEVLSIDPDLVGTSDIASRVGCDRETVRKWANSMRGAGNFPSPMGRINGGRKIWDWPTVNEWLKANGHFDSGQTGLSRDEFARLNALIRTRSWARIPEVRPFSLNAMGWPHLSSEILKAITFQRGTVATGLVTTNLDWRSLDFGRYLLENKSLEIDIWEEEIA